MNNTTNDGSGFLGSGGSIGGFGYGIGVSVGILLLITTITLASYFCTRVQQNQTQQQQQQQQHRNNDNNDDHIVVVDVGIDEATIKSYPKMLYSEVTKLKRKEDTCCCSICLADYKSKDMIRVLPGCDHLFHVKCVDPWLRLHPTCPLCRTSPVPSPISTPLAEVVPFAVTRN